MARRRSLMSEPPTKSCPQPGLYSMHWRSGSVPRETVPWETPADLRKIGWIVSIWCWAWKHVLAVHGKTWVLGNSRSRMGSPKSLHEDVYGHTPIYINIRCSISYYKIFSIMYCPFECIYVCFSLRSDDFFLCTIFVADWMIQSWFNVSSLSCSILGISMEPLLTRNKMTNKPLVRHELRVKNPRMVRKKLSHRIAHTVGRGLPPFKYASWRETGHFGCRWVINRETIPTVDGSEIPFPTTGNVCFNPECKWDKLSRKTGVGFQPSTVWRYDKGWLSNGLEDLHYRLTATTVSAMISSTKVSDRTPGISSWMLVGSILSLLMMDFFVVFERNFTTYTGTGCLMGVLSLFGYRKGVGISSVKCIREIYLQETVHSCLEFFFIATLVYQRKDSKAGFQTLKNPHSPFLRQLLDFIPRLS